ncbi:NUDIX domain-containing protein [Gulosibacter molinativorax]|uniref:NUDIX hydrolase n=1 Tax=Gulosibacter molinativorax TaxID=256821 RepID=A0ABT7CBC2_9MICO|nr:NUDIX hydrolase [Gulosibacter molinativorax]MDJ1372388.1 NUDIX hydrolase [Gulosibacter molinativorax]QUY61104.1 NUDIX hydrolase [Gulosibacter molinativorax]
MTVAEGKGVETGIPEFKDIPEDHEVLESSTPYRGWVWNLRAETVRYGDGELQREFIDHTGAVQIIALDEEDRVLFIRQYRHPVRSRTWEIPGGLLDAPGESALEAAKRELAEEADYSASHWAVLVDFWTTPGGSSESIRVYLARGLKPTGETFARTHEEADIEVAWIPLEDAVDAILRGDIHNPAVSVGILAANESRRRNWETLRDENAEWPTRPEFPKVTPKALASGNRA